MANLAQGWINHLRRQARNDQAALADTREEVPTSPSPKDHLRQEPSNDKCDDVGLRVPSEPAPSGDPGAEDSTPARKRLKSPTISVNAGRTRSPSPNRRTKTRNNAPDDESITEFPARPTAKTKGLLWNEGDTIPTRNQPAAQPAPQQHPRQSRRRDNRQASNPTVEEEDPSVNKMIGQPETRPISQEQLVAEVKGIYAGLVMVESKCIEVDSSQSAQNESNPKLNNEQWQALIALHRSLFHEHHDFFLASQHPSASPALRRLASKYAMPARMWRHGIHSFLELLRHRLPASLEHMLTFIYLAYSMMALLYETVPNFEDTWIECLGDIGRYRMAIKDEDIRDREIWTEVSRYWCPKASDKAPATGRLYHHLAILRRPYTVKQLFYYKKGLCVAIPFKSTRDSMLTVFDPIINGSQTRLQAIHLSFVKAHGILFIRSNTDEKDKALPKKRHNLEVEYEKAKSQFLSHLDNHIARTTRTWMEPGALIAISNCNAQLEYRKTEPNTNGNANVLMTAILPGLDRDTFMENSSEDKPTPSEVFNEASELAEECDAIISRRYGDSNVLAYLNVRLSFIKFIAAKPPPENWSLLRLPWVDKVFPGDRFTIETFDEGTRRFERLSLSKDSHGRLPRIGSEDGYFRCPGFHSEAFDDLQSTMHDDNLFKPGYHLIPLSLLFNIPRNFQYLAVLTCIAIPIASANVGIMEWAFGILASIPSTYVLANPPVPPTVDHGAEEVVWKFARGWGLTFGLVFAALLVTRLRTKYPPERRMYFVSVVFATSLAVMLLLLHFMSDDTWNVLDLLALCICFCATATYIITSESRGRDTVTGNRDEEEGGCQSLQDNPASIQPDQPPQVQGVPQPGGDGEEASAELHPSI